MNLLLQSLCLRCFIHVIESGDQPEGLHVCVTKNEKTTESFFLNVIFTISIFHGNHGKTYICNPLTQNYEFSPCALVGLLSPRLGITRLIHPEILNRYERHV